MVPLVPSFVPRVPASFSRGNSPCTPGGPMTLPETAWAVKTQVVSAGAVLLAAGADTPRQSGSRPERENRNGPSATARNCRAGHGKGPRDVHADFVGGNSG